MLKRAEHNSWIMVDGHVHVHDLFSLKTLFSRAGKNFSKHGQALHLSGTIHHFLLLTESSGTEFFASLRENADLVPGFRAMQTREGNCLCLQSEQNRTEVVYLVAGRQIVTAESLEILALGLDHPFTDYRPMAEVLRELKETSCLCVLPWGAGKWLGRRGRLVEQTVLSVLHKRFYLGDNGNRPFFWLRPEIFSRAAALGIRNLPGSDPLPFVGQEKRVADFGFFLPGTVERSRPFRSLRQYLEQPETNITPYGSPEHLLPFFNLQIRMQLAGMFSR